MGISSAEDFAPIAALGANELEDMRGFDAGAGRGASEFSAAAAMMLLQLPEDIRKEETGHEIDPERDVTQAVCVCGDVHSGNGGAGAEFPDQACSPGRFVPRGGAGRSSGA